MKGLNFIDPLMLWVLLVVPLYGFLRWWEGERQRRGMARFSDAALFKLLNPSLLVSGQNRHIRLALLATAFTLLVLALARPGGDPIYQEMELAQKGVDIMLLVDCSSSMNATDLSPDRMSATKAALKEFINQVSKDRVGMTIFAGSVSLQSPLTQDYRTAKMMVDIISTKFLPVDGTAIGDALVFALDKIGKDNQKSAVMVLLTDGENTKGLKPLEALEKVKTAGTRVYTIGVGTPEGAKIPMGKDERGNITYKQYMGETVVTKLDTEILEKIAQTTGGKYFSADTTQALSQAYAEIGRLTKVVHKEKKKKAVYKEYYYWLALAALLLLLTEMFFNRRSEWFRRQKNSEA